MSASVLYERCPETGIATLMIENGTDSVKVDLMPDEATDLENLVQSGDLAGARALVTGLDSHAGAAIGGIGAEDLRKNIR